MSTTNIESKLKVLGLETKNIKNLKKNDIIDIIKKKYIKLALKTHPNKLYQATEELKAKAIEEFQKISNAHNFLKNHYTNGNTTGNNTSNNISNINLDDLLNAYRSYSPYHHLKVFSEKVIIQLLNNIFKVKININLNTLTYKLNTSTDKIIILNPLCDEDKEHLIKYLEKISDVYTRKIIQDKKRFGKNFHKLLQSYNSFMTKIIIGFNVLIDRIKKNKEIKNKEIKNKEIKEIKEYIKEITDKKNIPLLDKIKKILYNNQITIHNNKLINKLEQLKTNLTKKIFLKSVRELYRNFTDYSGIINGYIKEAKEAKEAEVKKAKEVIEAKEAEVKKAKEAEEAEEAEKAEEAKEKEVKKAKEAKEAEVKKAKEEEEELKKAKEEKEAEKLKKIKKNKKKNIINNKLVKKTICNILTG